jgi:hypothetical protein
MMLVSRSGTEVFPEAEAGRVWKTDVSGTVWEWE